MALPKAMDQFDGAPLRYVVGEDGPRLYSIGTDRVDQGGQRCGALQPGVPSSEAQRWQDHGQGRLGDWVLFPAEAPDRTRWSSDREPNTALYHFGWLRSVEGLPDEDL